jgi:hypothetical protein
MRRNAYPDAVPTSEKPPAPRGAPLPPPVALDPPMVPFAVVGMALWAVAGLVLLPFRHTLAAHGHGSWLWICLCGFLWGFPGLVTMLRHDRHRRERRAAETGTATEPN